MKKILNLILLQGIISLISGILLSKMSLVGKIGISIVYTEYSLLKTWWKAALVVFIVQLIIIAILYISKRFMLYKTFVIINLILIIIGLLGVFFTYIDFTTTSNKYMNSKFHTGGYLVWLGWFINCIYFFIFSVKPKPTTESTNTDLNQGLN
nr:hypothetical protein [uncultured Flavobacterium sp.]